MLGICLSFGESIPAVVCFCYHAAMKKVGDYPWYVRWTAVVMALVGLACSTFVFAMPTPTLAPVIVLIKITALAAMWVFSVAFLSTAFHRHAAMAALPKHPLTFWCLLLWCGGGFAILGVVLFQIG